VYGSRFWVVYSARILTKNENVRMLALIKGRNVGTKQFKRKNFCTKEEQQLCRSFFIDFSTLVTSNGQ
jgi:hypothetical protein